ncbi:hypothetical protein SteCoe_533 [Stentor coeruleus]|uniref:Uncharacterized protein n=1 Tax=Stentor coeruleus TaxID=5963 RepID=A0A1R2D3Y9_9CILI|nr:hypothetical protein SteCoe_533 [Stentor coeruleus]
MWLVLALITASTACDPQCSLSCELFNAPTMCYANCGCDSLSFTLPISAEVSEEASKWQSVLAHYTGCSFSSYLDCQNLVCPHQYLQCVKLASCEALTDFKILVENIPSHLWHGLGQKVLTNTLAPEHNNQILVEYQQCLSLCLQSSASVYEISSNEFFSQYETCSEIYCAEGLKEFKANCQDNCNEGCFDGENTNYNCLDSCIENGCSSFGMSVVKGVREIFEDRCENNCFNGCDVSGVEDWSCYENCSLQQCEILPEDEVMMNIIGDECSDSCEAVCTNKRGFNTKCYNKCIKKHCQVKLEVPEVIGAISNCGQVCFQQCFVNYQMVSGCYNPCMSTCTSVALAEPEPVLTSVIETALNQNNNCEWSCYHQCFYNGVLDTQCYDNCVATYCASETEVEVEVKPLEQGNCAQQCVTKCTTDGVLNQACYMECYQQCGYNTPKIESLEQGNCAQQCVTKCGNISVENNTLLEQGNCAQQCVTKCTTDGVLNQACYMECYQQCGYISIEETKPLEQGNCAQQCVTKCTTDGVLNQACYMECYQQCGYVSIEEVNPLEQGSHDIEKEAPRIHAKILSVKSYKKSSIILADS